MRDLYETLSKAEPFFLLAGPCAIESEEHCLKMGTMLKQIADRHGIPYVFKSSFDKANRTAAHAGRGVGMKEGLRILKKVKETLGVPIVTDIHEASQAATVAEVADILQIPAFLCRQTDLLVAAGKTGKVINIKKGQFANATHVRHAAKKVVEMGGNHRVLLCERGNSWGYTDLIVDPRNLRWLREPLEKGGPTYPVVMDCTHAVQQPTMGSSGASSGGLREMVDVMGRMAVSLNVNGLFFEVHDDPDNAISDGPNSVRIENFEAMLVKLIAIARAAA